MKAYVGRFLFLSTLAVGLGVLSFVASGAAEEMQTKEQLINTLIKRPATRSLSAPDPGKIERQRVLIEELARSQTRGLTIVERTTLADIAKENDRPSVDMEIYFEYDSDAIRPDAFPTLIALGQALSDERLAGATFLIAGHTDAKGSDQYNRDLSQRRAQSVRRFLADNFQIRPETLIAVGYGEEQLKNPVVPEAGENRRVQVINLIN